MTNFKIFTGHDVALGSLVDFSPYQPMTIGIQYTQRNYSVSGDISDFAPFLPFTFPIMTEAQYITHLTQIGLATASLKRAAVTVYAQNDSFGWVRYNGYAQRALTLNRKGFFLRDVPLLITHLALSA